MSRMAVIIFNCARLVRIFNLNAPKLSGNVLACRPPQSSLAVDDLGKTVLSVTSIEMVPSLVNRVSAGVDEKDAWASRATVMNVRVMRKPEEICDEKKGRAAPKLELMKSQLLQSSKKIPNFTTVCSRKYDSRRE